MGKDDAYILWLMSLGIHRAWELISRYGSVEGVFRNAVEARVASYANTDYLMELVSKTQAALTSDGRFISYKNPDYPARLLQIPDRPLGIFVKGRLPDPDVPAVAIIGARDNSLYGRQVAEKLASELAMADVVVISGMARGLDAKAHKGALAVDGVTAAVLPGGVDVCYPAENFQLYKQIVDKGCVISEFLPGFRPQRWSFPARNRLITGLADVLVVVEAGEKSGTFTTVDHALDQGKEVFAVPGRIFDAKSKGTNELIKQGAHMLTSFADVLLALKISHSSVSTQSEKNPQNLSLASDEALVYACINHEAAAVDYIIYKTGLNAAQVNKILLNMELAGHIKKLPGQKYIKS